ncbi:hypothetical protein D7I39_20515 [Allopusillimonas ginsengisoli]|nr:hypothetical protein D7I39_20515 [Allopusillimonas ginsengisoli]
MGSPSSGAGSQAQRASENGMASGSGNAEANDGQPGSDASGTASGSAGTDSASADAAAATASSNSISSKADKTVSWLQEHTLGVITGVLALIVLIIAWLLRRANSVRNESSDGVITEAMVQEKLNQIDLDFAEPPAGSPRSPDR